MKIHIIGWNGITHSYSLVAETYCKGLLQNSDNKLYFTNNLTHSKKWEKTRKTIFDDLPTPNEMMDITIKFLFPYDMTPDDNSRCTLIFMTCEFNYMTCVIDTNDINDNVWILTPSEFSKKGIIASGISSEKIITVPHAYERIKVTQTKKQLRQKYNIQENDFVYYHSGAMTSNKNIESILIGFEFVYRWKKNVSLLLKGVNNIYTSENKVIEAIQHIKNKLEVSCEAKIIYIGDEVSELVVAEFYELSDCYLSPFHAEGFNLPVLEALSHGIQTICTRGGPPDEFAKDATFIDTEVRITNDTIMVNGNEKYKELLFPSLENFINLMMIALISPIKIDTSYYRENYSIQVIGNKLNDELKTICSHKYSQYAIILKKDDNLQKMIDNLLIFCGNTKIYVAVNDSSMSEISSSSYVSKVTKSGCVTKYIKPSSRTNRIIDSLASSKCKDITTINTYNVLNDTQTNKNLIYTNIDLSQSDRRIMALVMKTHKLEKAIYIDNRILLLCDPRILAHNYSHKTNIILTQHQQSFIYIIHNLAYEMQTQIMEFDNYSETNNSPYKWVTKRTNDNILYKLDNNEYKKIYLLKNDTNIDPNTVLKHTEKLTPIQKLLRQADVAIITSDVINKYTSIYRTASLTIMYDKAETQPNYDTYADKRNIFVYPESIEYFFQYLYPIIKNSFTLYLINDSEHIDRYKKLDTRNIIIDYVFRNNDETPKK